MLVRSNRRKIERENLAAEIGERIIENRNELGISQEELAEEIGVSINTLSNMENGKYFPKIDNIIMLSEAFSVSLEYMILGEYEPKEAEDPAVVKYKGLPKEEQRKLKIVMDTFYPG